MASPEASRVSVDTSIVVAALMARHQLHEPARELLNAALRNETILLSTRVLVESYSVLTRMPTPYRLSSADAYEVLALTFGDQAEVIGLSAEDTWRLLRHHAAEGVTGGAIYDAESAAVSMRAGARKILTLNRKHFDRVAADDVEIVGLE